METEILSIPFLPNYAISHRSPLLLDEVFHDFDAQAERLVAHDQHYLQLTPGRFRGRFLSGFFGPDIALHVEISDQSLLQEIVGATDYFTIGVTLAAGSGFATNGQRFAEGEVVVLPPRGSLLMQSPMGGAVAAFVVRRAALLAHPALTPSLAEWLDRLEGRSAGVLPAPELAMRLRCDCRDAIELSCIPSGGAGHAAWIGKALIASLASGLSLGWRGEGRVLAPSRRMLQFEAWRSGTAGGMTARQLEKALGSMTGLSPRAYDRLLRLHSARRELLGSQNPVSIGDIAAEFGFWDWSRFTAQYHKQFGERPSDTRRGASLMKT